MQIAAGLLVLAHLAVRAWIAFSRDFYGDDLFLAGRAAQLPLFSTDFLFGDFDGQFMPAAFLLAGVVSRVAPLEWWPEATMLVVLAALAALSVLRLLRTILGDSMRMLVPLGFFLFSPLSVGPAAWWASAINSLPLQIGMAWVVTDAIRFCRSGRQRDAVTGLVALALTYCFYVKAVLAAPVAFAVVALLLHLAGQAKPLRAAWDQGRTLWVGSAMITGVWAWAYLAVVPSSSVGSGTPRDVAQLVWSGLTRAVLPGVVAGPWSWTEVPGAVPTADAPLGLLLAAAVIVALAVWQTCTTLRGAGWVWALAGLHSVAGLVLVGLGRSGVIDDGLPPLAFRHFAGDAVVLALAGALLLRLTPPVDSKGVPQRAGWTMPEGRYHRWIVPGVAVLYVLSSLVSAQAYLHAWGSDRTGNYLAAVRTSLAKAGPSPLLDQKVPADVVWPLAYPTNMASRALAALPDRPPFVSSTDDLQVIDDDGQLRPGRVEPGVFVTLGPLENCGYLLGPTDANVPLDSPVFNWAWTVQLNYVSDRAGTLELALGLGEPQQVQITEGSNAVYVQLTGFGQNLHVVRQTPGMALCMTSGVVGNVVPD